MSKPEIIVLEENCDGRGGYIAIDKEKLIMKVSEVFPDTPLSDEIRNLTLLEYIKSDTEDKLLWKQYHGKLRDAGFDIEVIDIE